MKQPEYQLVLEFHGDSPAEFEQVVAIQEKLDGILRNGEVDGNDVGQGIVNIFIITKQPERCFEEVRQHIAGGQPQPAAAGYRSLDEEEYKRLWPQGDSTPFELK
jgi:hypothetical protein